MEVGRSELKPEPSEKRLRVPAEEWLEFAEAHPSWRHERWEGKRFGLVVLFPRNDLRGNGRET